MARFDVYANPEAAERDHTPCLLDVQNDFIDSLATRVMVPLRREAAFGPRPRNLNPLLTFGTEALVLDTAALGAVPLSALRQPIGELRAARAEVQEALDTLFGAY
jgi:toxin CcdB